MSGSFLKPFGSCKNRMSVIAFCVRRPVLLFLLIPLMCWVAAVQVSAAPEVLIHEVKVTEGGVGYRLEMRLSTHVQAQVFTLENPHRLVVDLPYARWAVPADRAFI